MRQRIIAKSVFWLGCGLIVGGSALYFFIPPSNNLGGIFVGFGGVVAFFGIYLLAFA